VKKKKKKNQFRKNARFLAGRRWGSQVRKNKNLDWGGRRREGGLGNGSRERGDIKGFDGRVAEKSRAAEEMFSRNGEEGGVPALTKKTLQTVPGKPPQKESEFLSK